VDSRAGLIRLASARIVGLGLTGREWGSRIRLRRGEQGLDQSGQGRKDQYWRGAVRIGLWWAVGLECSVTGRPG